MTFDLISYCSRPMRTTSETISGRSADNAAGEKALCNGCSNIRTTDYARYPIPRPTGRSPAQPDCGNSIAPAPIHTIGRSPGPTGTGNHRARAATRPDYTATHQQIGRAKKHATHAENRKKGTASRKTGKADISATSFLPPDPQNKERAGLQLPKCRQKCGNRMFSYLRCRKYINFLPITYKCPCF